MDTKPMSKIFSKEQYDKSFPESVRKEALKNILDIRKFEIELYWKRATYFWIFIGATFAGYISLLNSSAPNNKSIYTVLLLGVVFSLCWYLVNRGSKFWQLNWEKHLDAMENEIIGPLYKTTIERDYYKSRWYVLSGPYPFSVSKINILLSLFVLVLWLGILVDFIYSHKNLFEISFRNSINYYGYTSLIALIFGVVILVYGQTGKVKNDKFKTHVNFYQRTFSEDRANENGLQAHTADAVKQRG